MSTLAPVLLALALQGPAAGPSAPAFVLEAPLERQIVQRDERNGAEVRIEGSCRDGVPALVARVRRGDEDVVSMTLELRDLEGPRQRFAGSLRVPAGGLYALELAETQDGPRLFGLARFGVGEVFVVAGQSNSTNYGEERLPSSDDRVSAFDGARWSLAADPMPGVQDRSAGGSPWPHFGALLARKLDVPVGIASVGFGGTSIRAWQKDHLFVMRDQREVVLHTGLRERLIALGNARAILWHQGETDALGSMPSAQYVEHFTKLRADLAAELDYPLPPFVAARASHVPDLAESKMQAIRAAQAELWSTGAALRGPDTDDMLGDLRHSKDHIHFSKRGLEVHAERWIERVVALFFTPVEPGPK